MNATFQPKGHGFESHRGQMLFGDFFTLFLCDVVKLDDTGYIHVIELLQITFVIKPKGPWFESRKGRMFFCCFFTFLYVAVV